MRGGGALPTSREHRNSGAKWLPKWAGFVDTETEAANLRTCLWFVSSGCLAD